MANEDHNKARDTQSSKVRTFSQAASGTVDKASELASNVGAQAKQAISDTASAAKDHAKDLIDNQLGSGVKIVGQFAKSTRQAANDMAQHSPLVAGLMEAAADKVDELAADLEDRTIDHLIYSASDITRRQPALVFGVAALAGFFIYRAVKAAPPVQAPSIQPSPDAGV